MEGSKLYVIEDGVNEVDKTVVEFCGVCCFVDDPIHWWECPPVEGKHTCNKILGDV